MKPILATIIFFLCLTGVVGQTNDSIRQEIINQSATKIEILTKGRSYLLRNLEKGDLYKVREIKDALVQEANNNINDAFFPGEYTLILYWTEEYANLLDYIITDGGQIQTYRPNPMLSVIARNDLMYKSIVEKSAESYEVMIHFLDESELTNVEKDFLELHLYWMIFGPDSPTETEAMAEMNQRADAFLQEYPNSQFEQYVRENIRFKLAKSEWGLGWEIALGYAGAQGDMGKQFGDAFLMRLSLDGSYKKTILSLNLNVGGGSTKVDFPYKDTQWYQGSHAMMTEIDLSLGYRILEVQKFSFTPFVGIGAINFGPGVKEINEDKTLEKLNFTAQNYLAGLNCTFHLSDINNIFNNGGSFINLRYTFTKPQYNGRHGIESGTMHWVTLGWGMNGHKVKRMF